MFGVWGPMSLRSAQLLAAMTMMLAAPAAAQQLSPQYSPPRLGDVDDGPIRNQGLAGVGGYPGRGLQLRLDLQSRYESNLGRSVVADDGFRLRPQMEARYGIGLGQQGVYADVSVGRDMFFGAPNQRNRDRYQLGTGVDFRLSRCSGQMGGSWQRSLIFQSDAVAFGAFEQDRTSVSLGATCRISGALSVNGSISRQIFDSDFGLGNALNIRSWNYSGGLTLGNATLGQFSLSATINDTQFPGRLVVTTSGLVDDTLSQRNYRFGYQRAFGSKINLGVGVSLIDSQPGTDEQLLIIDGVPQLVARDGFRGAGFDVALDLNLTPRLGINVTATRNTFANPAVGAQFSVATNYVAALSYRLNERYALAVGASRRENRFRGGFVSDFDPFVRVSDDLNRFYAQLTGRFGRRLRLALDVTHNERRSDPSVFNFSSTGVGLNLGLQFGRGQS